MIINSVDLGDSHPWAMPITGQNVGIEYIEGGDAIVYPRGSLEHKWQVSFTLMGWQAMGGQAAFSIGATKYLLKQVEELARNRGQQPSYIQFSNTGMPNAALAAADLHDGWYVIDDFEPDYANYVVTGLVDCKLTATQVAAAPPWRTSLAYTGGALPTSALGATTPLIALPVGASSFAWSGGQSFARTGAEGVFGCITSPVAAPYPLQLSPTISQTFQGGVHVFDTINTSVNGGPVYATGTLWHSLGTEAGTDNSINYWTLLAGSPSYASHVVTMPAGGALSGAHPDTWDTVYAQRFTYGTGCIPIVAIHATGQLSQNAIRADFNVAGTTITLAKRVGGTSTGVVTSPAFTALTNGTSYWVVMQGTGTTYTITLYNDGGSFNLGSQIAQVSGTITDAILQSGQVGIGNQAAATGSCTFGGAGANVCTVTGPVPVNAFGTWATNPAVGEPAFCLSKNGPFAGTYALSIYIANAAGKANWFLTNTLAGGTYTMSGALRGSGGTPTVFRWQTDGGIVCPAGSVATIDGNWHQVSNSGTSNPNASIRFDVEFGTGTYYADSVTITDAFGNILMADGFETPFNANWVEVFDRTHDFVGDCVVTNGLLLLLFQVNTGARLCQAYLWNTALSTPGWSLFGSTQWVNNSGSTGVLQGYSPLKVSAEECILECVTAANGQASKCLVRLQRGHYDFRIRIRQLTNANTSNLLALNVNASGQNPKLTYNEAAATDNQVGAANLSATTNYLYAACFPVTTGTSFICGLLYENPAAQQPVVASTNIQLGDTSGPALGAEREYGVFAVPFGDGQTYSTVNLQAECESGTLGTGWSNVVDAAASAGHTAQLASGTASGNTDTIGPVWTPPAGTYVLVGRYRNSGAPTNASEAQVGVLIGGVFTNEITVGSGNGSKASYVPLTSSPFSLSGSQTLQFQIKSGTSAATVNHFFDEIALLPITQTTAFTGPQDIWQQFMQDLTRTLVTA